jgi:putative transcriptional regulator
MENRLRVLRAERRWTQERLAGAIGVSRQTINSIENGKYDPSLQVAFSLAAVLDCRIEDIFLPGG